MSSDVMSIAVAGLAAGQTRLEELALNAANATTQGFRRGVPVTQSFSAIYQGASASAASPADLLSALPAITFAPDLRQGSLTRTGRALDVAVDGDGYLMVTDGQSQWLTRAGALSIGTNGILTGPDGYRVVGMAGDIRVPSTDVSIASDGKVLSAGQVVGQIQIVKPDNPAALTSVDGVLWRVSQDSTTLTAADQASVRSGFLESSNANPLAEMTGVMTNLREYEGLAHLIQGYDDVLDKAIQKLGET